MRTLRRLALGVIGTLVVASPLLAHHDWPVDRTRLITVTGTVTAYRWADPHVMIELDVQANGTIEKWKVGGSNKKNSAVASTDGMMTANDTRMNGSGESINMIEPMIIATTPPIVSRPCEATFHSSTKRMMASAISAQTS